MSKGKIIQEKIKTIKAHGKDCNGCRSMKRDVMISFTFESQKKSTDIHDIFLTREQAKKLIENIQMVL